MNKRINFGKNPPDSFRESLQFDRDCPYKIRCKDLVNDDVAPLHYAETLEIEICCGIKGEMVIENERIEIDGDAVLVVPPGAVHSVVIRRGAGRVYLLQVSFEALCGVVDVETLLALSGRSFAGMNPVCPAFERVRDLVLEMIERDAEPFARTRALLEIFEILAAHMKPCAPSESERPQSGSDELRRILRWTEDNFARPVALGEAAAAVGFTKNYFCAWFKANTGLTYNRYLNNVRVSNACRLLAQTGSISTACYDSGFRDMSYFVQLFKKIRGCTPKAYLHNLAG